MRDLIQSLWIGPRLSTMERLCISSFLANGHRFQLYLYEETEGIPPGTEVRDAKRILPASRIFKYTAARPAGEQRGPKGACREPGSRRSLEDLRGRDSARHDVGTVRTGAHGAAGEAALA